MGIQSLIETTHVVQDVHLTFGWRLQSELLDGLVLLLVRASISLALFFLGLLLLLGVKAEQIHLLVFLLVNLNLFCGFRLLLGGRLIFVAISIVVQPLLLLVLLFLFLFRCLLFLDLELLLLLLHFGLLLFYFR